MKRYKWFRLKLPGHFSKFLKKAREFTSDPSGQYGFAPIESDSGRPRFRYLVRSPVVLTLVDAQGISNKQVFEAVDSIEFEVFEARNQIWLRIDDPPRSLRQFLNDLEASVGFGFSADPLSFSSDTQQKILTKADAFKMVGFKGIGSDSSAKIVARVEVASKEGVEPGGLPFLRDLRYNVDHTTFDVTHKMLKGQITFTASGIVRINGALQPYLLGCIERELHS